MTDQHGRVVSHPGKFDLWVECISIFMSHKYVMGHCHTAVSSAWPTLFARLQALFPHVDPRWVLTVMLCAINCKIINSNYS